MVHIVDKLLRSPCMGVKDATPLYENMKAITESSIMHISIPKKLNHNQEPLLSTQ